MNVVALDYHATYSEPLFRTRAPSASSARYGAHSIDYVTRFHNLVRQWRIDTVLSSRVEEKISHPAFRQIVDIGSAAVPLILRELRDQPDFLFVALHQITHENPLGASDVGRPSKMVDAWLSWGDRNGYVD